MDQLMNVAWTTGSSAQQNPEAAMAAVTAARDLVSRWTAAGLPPAEDYGGPLPVIYEDGIVAQVLGRLASLLPGAVGAGEHQTVARIVTAFALMLPRLVPEDQAFALDVVERALPTMARQVHTHEMNHAIRRLRDTVGSLGFTDVEKSIESVSATLVTPWHGLHPAVGSSPDVRAGR